MASSSLRDVCVDCRHLFEDAALIILSEPGTQKISATYDVQYQLRLQTNTNLRRCHMCALLCRNIPALLETLDSEERLSLTVTRPEARPAAVCICLLGESIATQAVGWYIGDVTIGHG